MKIPWLSKAHVAKTVAGLLADYEARMGFSVVPPIPVEDIIERHLGLTLSFDDLEARLGMPDVLGATYVKSRRIAVNERLLAERYEGRLVFTFAHEVGHWVLHRTYAEEAARRGRASETIVCRAGSAKEPIEWQADYFAACLLMPEAAVVRAFDAAYGADALVLHNARRTLSRPGLGRIEPCAENWPFLAAMVCEIGGFTNVSKQAMIIRLQDLGLLVNASGTPLNWRGANARRSGEDTVRTAPVPGSV